MYRRKLSSFRSKSFGIIMSSIMLVILLSSSASAFTVTYPSEVVEGDDIVISGAHTTANTDLQSSAEFEAWAEVGGDGRYEYNVGGFNVPSSPNTFSVTATNVQNIEVSYVLTLAQATANSGVATLSMSNVPAMTYPLTFTIEGDPLANYPMILLTFRCQSFIETDDDGDFEYTYNTGGLPTGEYFIRIIDVDGNSEAKFYVKIIEGTVASSSFIPSSSTSVKMVTITSHEIETSTDETTEEEETKTKKSSGGYSASEIVVVDKTSTEEKSEVKNTTAVEESVQMSVTEETETGDQTSEGTTVANDEPQDSSSILGKVMSWLLKII